MGESLGSDEEDLRSHDQLRTFANAVLGDWDDAMDKFFTKVDGERVKLHLDAPQTRRMLAYGYGEEVADNWDEWWDGML